MSVETLLSFFISEVHRRDMSTREESESTTESGESGRLKGEGEIMDVCVAVPGVRPQKVPERKLDNRQKGSPPMQTCLGPRYYCQKPRAAGAEALAATGVG